MGQLFQVTDFLHPVDLALLSHDEGYREGQIGKSVRVYSEEFPELEDADIVLLGCAEARGDGAIVHDHSGPDAIRHQFYSLYYWHPDVQIADLGNIRRGATLQDTYAALKTVVAELVEAGKRVVILGGSHDLTLAQYEAYKSLNKVIEATGIDALINLATDLPLRGKALSSFPITPDSPLSADGDRLKTIHFARERRVGDKGRSYTVNIGFERIADGDRVMALLREAQRAKETA